MEIFALLAACVCIGLSSGRNIEVYYGESYTFQVPTRAEYLYFQPQFDSSSKSALWTRSKTDETVRGEFWNGMFTIEKLTQQDDGFYIFETRNQRFLDRHRITVSYRERTFDHMVGEELHFEVAMDPKLCKLIFTNADGEQFDILRSGNVWNDYFGPRLELRPSNGPVFSIYIEDLQVEDTGVFEVKDHKNNVALWVNVNVAASVSLWANVAMAAGLLAVVVTCCCCMKRCCCKKSSKSSDPDPQPTESPANLQQYSVEPRPPMNPAYAYAYQPANPAPSVEMYSPAASVPFTAPPAQAQPATGGQAAAMEVSDASSFLSSDTEARFELKGMQLAPPLYSECTSADVYTSDKLNFKFL